VTVNLIWKTPDAENLLAYIARVSNPDNQDNPNIAGLIGYMWKNGHFSPFEMVSMCIEVDTVRDIGRQILRHKPNPQEFSQRYQSIDKLGSLVYREFRVQDKKNRQKSIEIPKDDPRHETWKHLQEKVIEAVYEAYDWCLAQGGAKEVARAVLPEGMTPTRMYFSGNLRDWIHYVQVRTDPTTQKEHRLIAEEVKQLMIREFPVVSEVLEWSDE